MKHFIVLLTLTFAFAAAAAAQDPATPAPVDRSIVITPFGPFYTFQPQTGARGATGVIVAGAAGGRLELGAWWNNKELVSRLGLTDDQKARIESAYENHRQSLATNTAALEKEEKQLNALLAADPVDRNAVYSQIDRVVQARGELERVNSVMTLEMREVLNQNQWSQLARPAAQTSAPTTPQRIRQGGNVAAQNLIPESAVPPVYPPLAAQARLHGTVILEADINPDGTVQDLKVVSGHPLLVQAAMDAVKQWRYMPTKLNGQPVAVTTTVTVNFP